MLRVTDKFHTQDGEWFVSGKPYSITKEAIEKYGGEDIEGEGAAHHIFVRVPLTASVLEFNTEDGKNPNIYYTPATWTNFAIFQAYDPNIEQGAWLVRIDGEKVAEGIGLPHGWHVSTFLVVEEAGDVVLPEQPSAGDSYLVLNGVTVWRN
jgi:hypothetical protein